MALRPSVTSFSRDKERSQLAGWPDGRRDQIHSESDSPLAKSTTTEEPKGNAPPAHTADSVNAQTITLSSSPTRAIVSAASQCLPLKGEIERMARRRYQDPTPKRRGKWWTLRYRQDEIVNGKLTRVRKEVRLALVNNTSEKDARRQAAEHLRPLNQGLESIGAAVNFKHYVEKHYIPLVMPLLAKSTQDRYEGVLDNYLVPTFGELSLRDLTPMTLQSYFSKMAVRLQKSQRTRFAMCFPVFSVQLSAMVCWSPIRSRTCNSRRTGAVGAARSHI